MIVLYWVTEHFPDFEGSAEMTDFLDWFEARLLEDVSTGQWRPMAANGGHSSVILPHLLQQLIEVLITAKFLNA